MGFQRDVIMCEERRLGEDAKEIYGSGMNR